MRANMKFSVIVPFWNAEQWIARCCDSLTKQKGDFEFLLIDDHSTDNGRNIVYEYCNKDDRFTLVTNQHAKGVSGARNTGIDIAKGEWVTFLDADDELCDKAYYAFERMSWSDCNMVQSNHLRKRKTITEKCVESDGIYGFRRLPNYWCMVWNKIFRAEFLEGVRFIDGMQYGEDEAFILDCLLKYDRIEHTDEFTVLRHFDNKGSLSHTKDKAELVAQCRALEDFLLRSDNPTANAAVLKVIVEHWSSIRFEKKFCK